MASFILIRVGHFRPTFNAAINNKQINLKIEEVYVNENSLEGHFTGLFFNNTQAKDA